jgi:ribonuclease Z
VQLYEDERFNDTEFRFPTGHHFRGQSVGGETTCLQMLGSINSAFDIGYAPLSATGVPTVFISHGHADHVGGIARHATRRHGRKLEPANYYVPHFLETGVKALFEAMRILEGSPRSGNIIPLGLDSKIQINRDRYVVPFEAHHRIPCFGYVVWESRKRLRADLKGASPEVIKAKRKAGEDINETFEIPDVAYCGDTKIDVLKSEPNVRKARLLLLECTMLDDKVSVEDTRRAGHIHLDEILAEPELLAENECVLLTHFSARYSAREVREILAARLPESLKSKIVPLLP